MGAKRPPGGKPTAWKFEGGIPPDTRALVESLGLAPKKPQWTAGREELLAYLMTDEDK